METPWEILVVDDEPDIFKVTEMAIKRRSWQGRPFRLTYADSKAKAIEILSGGTVSFSVAFIDVVMESDTAGLELCQYIRKTAPRSLRIILRTGQPGSAPEESVMNDYDIDIYLAKSEATPDALYKFLRSALRFSQEALTLQIVSKQLGKFSEVISKPQVQFEQLAALMINGVDFLRSKHQCAIAIFIGAITHPHKIISDFGMDASELEKASPLVLKILNGTYKILQPFTSSEAGMGTGEFILIAPLCAMESDSAKAASQVKAGIFGSIANFFAKTEHWEQAIAVFYFKAKYSLDSAPAQRLLADVSLFLDNWRIGHAAFRMQKELAAAILSQRSNNLRG